MGDAPGGFEFTGHEGCDGEAGVADVDDEKVDVHVDFRRYMRCFADRREGASE